MEQISSKVWIAKLNEYVDYLIYPSFQGVNRLFVSRFEMNPHRARHTGYILPKVEIKDHNNMIDGQKSCIQPVKNDQKTW